MSTPAADPGDLVEDLTFRCLEGLETGGPRVVDELLAEHEPAMQAKVRRMLATLTRVGLAGSEALEGSPEQIGPYRLLERIGAGAMGVVYRAQREGDSTELALKLLQPGLVPLRGIRVRFRREIAALRELDHPGICPILDDGEVEGVPYLAMPFVPGESLRERFGRGAIGADPAERERLLRVHEKVAMALHHAHEHGFVHRDVKPGNVMVRPDGEPVLLDFGLARLDRPDAGSTLTAPGGLVGTPAYMAPEQVAGSASIDRRCDVYALGVMLYEGLTGRLPHEAPTRESLYRRILAGEVERPSRLARGLPADLDVVCLTALERDPGRRYRTALDLARDLQRVRTGESPSARLPGLFERGRRWVRRNPLPAALLGVVFAAVAGLLVVAARLLESGNTARARALAAAAHEVLPAAPDVALHLALKAHDLDPVLEVWPPMQAAVAVERAEWRLAGHAGPVRSLAFSGDGSMLLSGSTDGSARLWRLGTGRRVLVLEHGGPVSAVAFRPDCEVAVTAGADDGRICAWDTDTGKRVWEQEAHSSGPPVHVLRWSPDGRFLLTGGGDVDARLWTADGQPFCQLPGTEGHVHAGVWLDASTVATGSGSDEGDSEPSASYSLRVWRIREGAAGATLLREIPHEAGIVAIHPNPIRTDRALVITRQTVAWLFDFERGKRIRELDATFSRSVSGGGWSSDGTRAFTTASGGGIASWDAEGKWLNLAIGPDHIALSLANPGFPLFALCGDYGTLSLRTYDGRQVREIGRQRLRGEPLAFSADGRWLAAVNWKDEVLAWRIWDPEQPLFAHGGRALSAVWASGGREVVTGGGRTNWSGRFENDGWLRVWDVASGRLSVEITDDVQILGMRHDPFSERLVVSHGRGQRGFIRVLSRRDGEWRQDGEVLRKPEIGFYVFEVCFAGLDQVLLCDHAGRLLVWDLATRTIVQRLPPEFEDGVFESIYRRWMTVTSTQSGDITWAAGTMGYLHRFDRSASGTYTEAPPILLPETLRALKLLDDGSLLVGGGNGFLQRRMPDGSTIPFLGHAGLVHDIDWTFLDGEVVVASADSLGSIRIWRSDGTPLREIRAHDGGIWTVSFSPDGTRLLSASVDGTARIWLTRNEDLLDLARRRLRPLTDAQRQRFRKYLNR